VCGDQPTIHSLIDYEEFCGVKQALADEVRTHNSIRHITARELQSRLNHGDAITIIDVREPHEWDIVNLSQYGAQLVPLAELSDRLSDINVTDDVVVHCKSGARSAKAAQQLRAAGLERVWNLQGGIIAWADEIDTHLARY
jgi:adenylyltransferase/sulfurtransferase